MEGATLAGLIGIGGLFILLALRMPVAIALIVVGGLAEQFLGGAGHDLGRDLRVRLDL